MQIFRRCETKAYSETAAKPKRNLAAAPISCLRRPRHGGSARELHTYDTILKCVYADIGGRNNVSKSMGIDVKTVTKWCAPVAHVAMESDDEFMRRIASLFKARPPSTFVGGFSCDATQETLTLPMVGFEGEGAIATRSAWHVLVSSHRFSWSPGGYCECLCARPWERVQLSRPNVALTSSESALTLWNASFHVRSVQGFATFEIEGVTHAVRAFLNYDLDGHPANVLLAAHRRTEVIQKARKIPAVSVFHCGNHRVNLIENALVDCFGPEPNAFMVIGCAFSACPEIS